MADIKMNKVAKFNALANMIAEDATFEDGSDVREFLTHEAEVTAKRNAHKSSKPTKKQIENAEVLEQIKSLLVENKRMTASEIAKALDLSSPQKVTGIVRTADISTVKDKRVTYCNGISIVRDKRVTYYTLLPTED